MSRSTIEAMSRSRSIGRTPCWLRFATPAGPHPRPRTKTIPATRCFERELRMLLRMTRQDSHHAEAELLATRDELLDRINHPDDLESLFDEMIDSVLAARTVDACVETRFQIRLLAAVMSVYRPDIYTSGALEIGQHFYGRAERRSGWRGRHHRPRTAASAVDRFAPIVLWLSGLRPTAEPVPSILQPPHRDRTQERHPGARERRTAVGADASNREETKYRRTGGSRSPADPRERLRRSGALACLVGNPDPGRPGHRPHRAARAHDRRHRLGRRRRLGSRSNAQTARPRRQPGGLRPGAPGVARSEQTQARPADRPIGSCLRVHRSRHPRPEDRNERSTSK